jgi:hypothetical protein
MLAVELENLLMITKLIYTPIHELLILLGGEGGGTLGA